MSLHCALSHRYAEKALRMPTLQTSGSMFDKHFINFYLSCDFSLQQCSWPEERNGTTANVFQVLSGL